MKPGSSSARGAGARSSPHHSVPESGRGLVSYTNNQLRGRPMPKLPKEAVAITTPHVAGDEDIGEIRNIVGFHIRLAHGAVYRHFTETFADLELTQKQVSALWLID